MEDAAYGRVFHTFFTFLLLDAARTGNIVLKVNEWKGGVRIVRAAISPPHASPVQIGNAEAYVSHLFADRVLVSSDSFCRVYVFVFALDSHA
jgi:hypothetical protein